LSGAGRNPPAQEVKVMTMTLQVETSLEQLLGTVGEAMESDVVLLAADMPAERAVRRLEHKAVSGAPVVDRGRVVGVVTRRDLLVPTLLDDPTGHPDGPFPVRRDRLAGLRVSDLMSDQPVTARPDWPLLQAVRVMIDNGVNRLPVVDQNRTPLGILTRDNVLRALARSERGSHVV
jgi:predicted transcriptional regulator